MSLYGTRDAAQNWAKDCTTFLVECGFKAGLASPCNLEHVNRELKLTVQGDDFTMTGPTADLLWEEWRKIRDQDALLWTRVGQEG